MKTYDVYYVNAEGHESGIYKEDLPEKNIDFLKEGSHAPHYTYLLTMEADDLEDLFYNMQGEVWSPNGEARDLIKSKGLYHTSMSIGDIAHDRDTNTWWTPEFIGWKQL